MVRDLVGTVTREKADLGVMITSTKPTKAMEREAADAGFYNSPMGGKHPKVQVLTIEDLLNGKGIDYPTRAQRVDLTFRRARRVAAQVAQELPLSAFIGPAEGAPSWVGDEAEATYGASGEALNAEQSADAKLPNARP